MRDAREQPIATATAATQRWAVCADVRGAHAESIRRLLSAEAVAGERWFAIKDVEDLDAAVREGTFDVVVFSFPECLYNAIFDGKVRLDEWAARGVMLRLGGADCSAPYATDLCAVAAAYRSWCDGQRKRRIVAAIVLSVIALACAVGQILLSGVRHAQ